MPIRKDLKPLYPANWEEIRAKILERAHGRCEWCEVVDGSTGFRDSAESCDNTCVARS